MPALYALVSVIVVSLVSFAGVLTLAVRDVKKIVLYLVSFSAGAFFGDVFFHMLPEVVKTMGFTTEVSLLILSGIVAGFIVEKIIRWRHHRAHTAAVMNLVGDGVHNFIDGLMIGATYLVSTSLGFATTFAVICHEIPQEIGDFGVLLHGGFSRKKALLFNFLSALVAVIGAVVALVLGTAADRAAVLLVPVAAGNFLYIAGSDLIPELHEELSPRASLLQIVIFILGIATMAALLLVG